MEDRPFVAAGICALLGMYNIVNKTTVALAWVGMYSPSV